MYTRTTGHQIKSAWTRLIPKICPMAKPVAELATECNKTVKSSKFEKELAMLLDETLIRVIKYLRPHLCFRKPLKQLAPEGTEGCWVIVAMCLP